MVPLKSIALSAFLVLFSFSTQAYASLIGATVDITAETRVGAFTFRTANVTGRMVGEGSELVAADWGGSGAGFFGVDISANEITVNPLQTGNYDFASLLIRVTSGPAIAQVLFDGYISDFFQPDSTSNDSNLFPSIDFGADFISIVWDTERQGQFVFNGDEPIGAAEFLVATTSVPEPGTLALLVLGLVVGFGLRRRAVRLN